MTKEDNIYQILTNLKELTENAKEEKQSISYIDYLVDLNKVVEKPPCILKIIQENQYQHEEIDLLNSSDLSLLTGMQKSKKTFFCSVIFASMINGYFGRKLKSENVRSVAYIDTEQSDYYAYKTSQRIYQTTKSNFDYLKLRKLNPSERKQVIQTYLYKNQNVDFIIIDGIVDLVYDFNDLKECTEAVQWLMKLSSETQTHILSVLHTNAGEDRKARGHLGTLLSQKVETVLHIQKNKENSSQSIISAKDVRGKQFDDFVIEIDNLGNSHLFEKEEYETTKF